MKIVNVLIILLLVLVSIAAGLAKVMQTDQEMEFLQSFGLNSAMIIAFGIVQIGGNFVFGFLSTIPVVLAALIAYQSSALSRLPTSSQAL